MKSILIARSFIFARYLTSTAYPGVITPFFSCTSDEEKDPILNYHSHRPGLHPVATGKFDLINAEGM